jgi:DNA repair exonuclease SbcCD ATPase subunit
MPAQAASGLFSLDAMQDKPEEEAKTPAISSFFNLNSLQAPDDVAPDSDPDPVGVKPPPPAPLDPLPMAATPAPASNDFFASITASMTPTYTYAHVAPNKAKEDDWDPPPRVEKLPVDEWEPDEWDFDDKVETEEAAPLLIETNSSMLDESPVEQVLVLVEPEPNSSFPVEESMNAMSMIQNQAVLELEMQTPDPIFIPEPTLMDDTCSMKHLPPHPPALETTPPDASVSPESQTDLLLDMANILEPQNTHVPEPEPEHSVFELAVPVATEPASLLIMDPDTVVTKAPEQDPFLFAALDPMDEDMFVIDPPGSMGVEHTDSIETEPQELCAVPGKAQMSASSEPEVVIESQMPMTAVEEPGYTDSLETEPDYDYDSERSQMSPPSEPEVVFDNQAPFSESSTQNIADFAFIDQTTCIETPNSPSEDIIIEPAAMASGPAVATDHESASSVHFIETSGDLDDIDDDIYADDDDDLYDDEDEEDDEVDVAETELKETCDAALPPEEPLTAGMDVEPIMEPLPTPALISESVVSEPTITLPDIKHEGTDAQEATDLEIVPESAQIDEDNELVHIDPLPSDPGSEPVHSDEDNELVYLDPAFSERVEAETKRGPSNLESEMDAALKDSSPPTPAPPDEPSQPLDEPVQQSFFGFGSPAPTQTAASSIFGYMLSAAPFSDPSERNLNEDSHQFVDKAAKSQVAESAIRPTASRPVELRMAKPVFVLPEIVKMTAAGGEDSGADMIPASVLDAYTAQMQRMQDYHDSELQELKQQHEDQLQKTLASFNHEKCAAERDGLSERFMGKLRQKEEQLQEMMRINEGMKLKVDGLKRELDGTKEVLKEKEKSIGTVSSARDKEKQTLEQRLKEIRESEGIAKADINQLREQLKAAREEIANSEEAYGTLKARVKVVATELKDRRAECRTLDLKIEEMVETNEQLQAELNNMKLQLGDRDRNQTEKDEEMDNFKDKVKQLEEELKEADKKIQQRGLVGEKALAAYKKKAQNSMSVANARTAAATQAKEDAESEAQGARSAAEEAIQRAKDAEAAGKATLLEAREYVKEVEAERNELVQKAQDAVNALEQLQHSLAETKADCDAVRSSKEKMAGELNHVLMDLQLERNRTSELQQEVSDLQKRSNNLYDEVETLRDELRRKATAAFMAKSQSGSESVEAGQNGELKSGLTSAETTEAESTIIMLQRELKASNQAIKELKETLRSTIEQQIQRPVHSGGSEESTSPGQGTGPEIKSAGAPLFYAMEKQAELNTARSEINRLANLLGDAQSEKMEAFEAMQEMRKNMEEADARLRRYEKLGRKTKSAAQPVKQVPTRTLSPKRHISSASDSGDELMDDNNSASVNLEYLKNVMMSFFNAKTLAEKKALMPVVGSVLCLTPEEQHRAFVAVETSGSLENTGISLFENVGAQLGFKLV